MHLDDLKRNVGEYHQGWEAADQYAYEVLTGGILAGKQVKACCERYLRDRQRKDLTFDTEAIDAVIGFANRLKHVKGEIVGQPIRLQMWMIFILANTFGWYYKGTDERRFKRIFTLVARGNAKSFLCSIIGAWGLLTSPNGSPNVFSVARTSSQSRIVLEDASKMLRGADANIKNLFDIRRHEILTPHNHGRFDYRSSDAQNLDGVRTMVGIVDELHAHPSPEILNTVINGASATKNPQIFMISTAGRDLDGVCIHERDLVREINAGLADIDSYFGIEFSIDDLDNWQDEECFIKANPSLGHAVKPQALRDELVRAKQNATNRSSFMTKHLNLFVSTANDSYLDMAEVIQCRSDLKLTDYKGQDCFIGLDLAQKSDLTSLTLIFPDDNGGIDIFTRNYLPESALNSLSDAQRTRYDNMIDTGSLIITPTKVTDFNVIANEIRQAAKDFNLVSVGFDPYAGAQLANELGEEGIEMVEVRQSYAAMSEPAKLLAAMFKDGKVRYQSGDSCLEWCASNAVQTADLNDNIKVHKAKERPNAKVDTIIALITGLAVAKLREHEETVEARGWLFV